jgi:hemerythrin superfamily protein
MAKQTVEQTDAIDMLKKDHGKVTQLFKQFESAQGGDKQSIVSQIFHELEVHTVLEEELFYPAVRDQIDPKELAAEEGEDEGDEEAGDDLIAISYEEHQAVKDLIQELKKMDPQSDQFKERFEELRDDVTDHVSEEEEVIFPLAQLKLNVEELGSLMQKRKQEFLASAARR